MTLLYAVLAVTDSMITLDSSSNDIMLGVSEFLQMGLYNYPFVS